MNTMIPVNALLNGDVEPSDEHIETVKEWNEKGRPSYRAELVRSTIAAFRDEARLAAKEKREIGFVGAGVENVIKILEALEPSELATFALREVLSIHKAADRFADKGATVSMAANQVADNARQILSGLVPLDEETKPSKADAEALLKELDKVRPIEIVMATLDSTTGLTDSEGNSLAQLASDVLGDSDVGKEIAEAFDATKGDVPDERATEESEGAEQAEQS